MANKPHIIFVPGLGDENIRSLQWIVRTWKVWGLEAELFQMNWSDDTSWDAKFERLLQRIDALLAQNKQVGLIGASAGAAAVINVYTARVDDLIGCLLISGKVNRPQAIGPKFRQKYPSFITAAYACEQSLLKLHSTHRQRIISLYAAHDSLVHEPDSYIEGAHNKKLPTVGHTFTIALMLIFGPPYFKRYFSRLAQK